MSRELWGEFEDEDDFAETDKYIPISAKRSKLEEMNLMAPTALDKNIIIKVKNPVVTQTIEVMKQTEMLQALIDTYSNKSEYTNYLVNPCQVVPDVDFPIENSAKCFVDDKFTKPIWFIPPLQSNFIRGVPKHYPEINKDVCRAALRKTVCGELRVNGFTDAAESALLLFTDALQEFIFALLREVHVTKALRGPTQGENKISICMLEKAYQDLTNHSIMQIHNYYKHNLLGRNRSEIAEFKGALHEYDELMKQSQNMQKNVYQTDNIGASNEYMTDLSKIQTQNAGNLPDANMHYEMKDVDDKTTIHSNVSALLSNNMQYNYTAPNTNEQFYNN